MKREKRVRRFDIASILETAFEQNEWKGDEHHRGVFFTDDKGYCINKVLAIRAQHEEKAPKVFYSFFAPTIDEQVTLDFPYDEMELKPKKHHLLIDKKKMMEEDMDDLFTVSPIAGEMTIECDEVYKPIDESVPNKRERDRTQVHLKSLENGINMTVVRTKKSEQIIRYSRDLVCSELEWNDKNVYKGKINANTLHTVLQIFPRKTKVLFQFARDRMKLTGNLSTLEGEQSRVEVVIALMKG